MSIAPAKVGRLRLGPRSAGLLLTPAEYWLRQYQVGHPQGSSLDLTLPEEEGETRQGQDRRRVDRAIWTGLGRDPEEGEVPAIAAEFVSAGKANQERDYIVKRAESREIGVREYWVIDRFKRTLTVCSFGGAKDEERVIAEGKTYETPLLPGFVLDVQKLLAFADRWAKKTSRGRKRPVAMGLGRDKDSSSSAKVT